MSFIISPKRHDFAFLQRKSTLSVPPISPKSSILSNKSGGSKRSKFSLSPQFTLQFLEKKKPCYTLSFIKFYKFKRAVTRISKHGFFDAKEGVNIGVKKIKAPSDFSDFIWSCRDACDLIDYDDFFQNRLKTSEPMALLVLSQVYKILLFLIYYIIGVVVYVDFEPSWSILDSIYFITVSITTVGYGDLVPTSNGMRLFTMFYVLVGIILVVSVIIDAVQNRLTAYEVKMHDKFVCKKEEENDSVPNASMPWIGNNQLIQRIILHRKLLFRLLFALFLFWTPILLGAIYFSLAEFRDLDGPFLNGVYWSVITLTTVGYGDLDLSRRVTRLFSIFFILIGFIIVSFAISVASNAFLDYRLEKHRLKVLRRNLSVDMIEQMDVNGDGVDRAEFLIAMLVEQKKLDYEEDILPILKRFDDLDADGSGTLTKDDILIIQRKRRHSFFEENRLSERNERNSTKLVSKPTIEI